MHALQEWRAGIEEGPSLILILHRLDARADKSHDVSVQLCIINESIRLFLAQVHECICRDEIDSKLGGCRFLSDCRVQKDVVHECTCDLFEGCDGIEAVQSVGGGIWRC